MEGDVSLKKSITIIGKPVQYAFLIKDIDIDKMTVEKYEVECRSNIESSWGAIEGQVKFPEQGDKTLEIVLKDKVSNVTLTAKANVIEMAAKMGGRIVKDINIERVKRGKKTFISGIEFFNEAI